MSSGGSKHALCMLLLSIFCAALRAKNMQNSYVRTYVRTGMRMNKASYRKPVNRLYPLPAKKNFKFTPRATRCTDRGQTSTTVSGRPSSVDPVKRLCERCAYEEKCMNEKSYQKFTNISIHTWYVFTVQCWIISCLFCCWYFCFVFCFLSGSCIYY